MKILSSFILLWVSVFSLPLLADSSDEGVIFRYREYERFDFEDLVIEGDTGSPGDLSIAPRFQRQFDNRLPYRTNFHAEIKKAVERTR